MALDTHQQMLIEQRISNEAKSPLLAYLLLIFVGGLGIHRFYLGRTGSGVAMLLLLILGAVTLPIGVGLILLLALGIWMLADLFLIPGMVNQQRDLLRQSLRSEFAANA
ncbi:TM2 domain-containing protein [Paracoccus yeei]|uniref:TM2 domain-containing protein n=1 Tax=Paracoccus yeei TaxID=147645 RepID=A0A5P2QNZ0_9RHOB|nr:TM2 domain-containing protein [Paracoccus yeei]OWJ96833.1 TM2 domain-containing protein [Paracoccus yeei]QEU07737.1 TM2 domain-containing protein [Paracoccus yeei]